MEEPSVLDYVISRLKFWRKEKVQFPPEGKPLKKRAAHPARRQPRRLPWRSLLALLLALAGQRLWEPGSRALWPGVLLYLVAAGFLVWAHLRGEWVLQPYPVASQNKDPLTARRIALLVALPATLLAFLTFGGNMFTGLNLALWLAGLVAAVWAFWLPDPLRQSILARIKQFFSKDRWQISISRWTLLMVIVLGLVVFFRVYRLAEVPAEPFSDHAEKLLDVYDVVHGQTRIFFPRNTGREAFQIYWTAAIAGLFGTGISFNSLKIGTAILGLLMLPYMYLLGKEVGSKRIGLLALLLAGIAYWPNVISRSGLRFPLYPLFVAPTLYYLIRGLRTSNRNHFILSGIFLGIGLHGYSPFRVMPFVVVVAVGLYLLHARSKEQRRQVIWWFFILAIISLLVFLPLARYAMENPGGFNYRLLSRMGNIETPLPGPAWKIFLSNLWNALKMFNWSDGEIWVHSVTYRPALDVVSAALFLIACLLVFIRYLRQRNWVDLFLLLCIPFLLLPSILALAFPAENPALNRAAGAVVPVFLLAAMSLDGLFTAIQSHLPRRLGTLSVWVAAVLLLGWSAMQNYDLVFHQYDRQFRMGAWNSSEMGDVVRQFDQTYGSPDNIWIIPYPHWVDTRLPAIWAGIPNRDMAMWPEDLNSTLTVPGVKLFMLRTEDENAAATLQRLYPQGVLSRFRSQVENHDFLIFFVPATVSTP